MKIKCDGCQELVDVLKTKNIDGKTLCLSCAPEQFSSSSSEDKIVAAELTDLGYKEDISPDGVKMCRFFNLKVTNNSLFDIKWVGIGIVISSQKDDKVTGSYVHEGSTKYTSSTYARTDYYKSDLTSKDLLPRSQSIFWNNSWIRDGNPVQNFRKLEVYNVYGEYVTGERFNFYCHPVKNFDANGYFRESEKKGCFVTTVAFGDPLHPMVVDFRSFRDEVMVKSKFGRIFIDWYNQNGPYAADFIECHPWLRFICRVTLVPVALAIRNLRLIFKHLKR